MSIPVSMDSPELKLFLNTTRHLLAEPGSDVRQLHAAGEPFDRRWWKRAAELGWTALAAPDPFGGSIGDSAVADLAALAREFGRHIAPGPLLTVSTVLAAFGDQAVADAHADTVEGIVAGDIVASWAFSGDGVPGRRVSAVTATARPGGYVLDGVVERVEAAGHADMLLVPAAMDDGVAQLLVHIETPGVSVRPVRSIDLVRHYSSVHLAGVSVDFSQQVGEIHDTPATLDQQIQLAVLLRCAETVGVVEKAFDITRQWAADRYSFGRPLESYQSLKHRYADMKMWLLGCQAITDAALAAFSAAAPRAAELISAAKSYTGEKGVRILQDCIQLHGGIGVTWEHDLHLYLRRAALNANTFGTPDDHCAWLADRRNLDAAS